jgi:hypothetical protein
VRQALVLVLVLLSGGGAGGYNTEKQLQGLYYGDKRTFNLIGVLPCQGRSEAKLLWSMIDSCWRTPNHDHIRAGCDVRIQSILFSIS